MNRLGVLADLSGASGDTIRRALAVSKAPVLCTRSAARRLRPHPANLPDDLLAALGAAKGLCLVPLTAEQTGPTVRDVADHLDHVRAVAGPMCRPVRHVRRRHRPPAGARRRLLLSAAHRRAARRGWAETDIALLTWGNVQRVLRGADFTARRPRNAASRPRRRSPTWTAEGPGANYGGRSGRGRRGAPPDRRRPGSPSSRRPPGRATRAPRASTRSSAASISSQVGPAVEVEVELLRVAVGARPLRGR